MGPRLNKRGFKAPSGWPVCPSFIFSSPLFSYASLFLLLLTSFFIFFHLPSLLTRQAYRGGAFKKWPKSYPFKIVVFLGGLFLLTG